MENSRNIFENTVNTDFFTWKQFSLSSREGLGRENKMIENFKTSIMILEIES